MPQYVDGNQFRIENGPSKFDLMLALFAQGHSVNFRSAGLDFKVKITGIELESGSAEDWLFKGYLLNADEGIPNKVEGYFSTQHRHGHLRLHN